MIMQLVGEKWCLVRAFNVEISVQPAFHCLQPCQTHCIIHPDCSHSRSVCLTSLRDLQPLLTAATQNPWNNYFSWDKKKKMVVFSKRIVILYGMFWYLNSTHTQSLQLMCACWWIQTCLNAYWFAPFLHPPLHIPSLLKSWKVSTWVTERQEIATKQEKARTQLFDDVF